MLQLGIIVIIKPEGWRPDHTLYALGFDRSLCHSLQSMFGVVNFHDSGFFHQPPVTIVTPEPRQRTDRRTRHAVAVPARR
jgi:hypothetical protein